MKQKLLLLLAGTIIFATANGQTPWYVSGNSISSGDFLGTTNGQPLVIKVNNTLSGLLDYDNTKGNTAFGYQAFLSITGAQNTAIGYQALTANTGNNNTANGSYALLSNTSGAFNTANGSHALHTNTTGSRNTAIGFAVLYANTTGSYNVASGSSALGLNTTGSYNVASGSQALSNNTAGAGNSAYGYQALYSNTTTNYLTAIGYQALYSNTSGSRNTAIGYNSQISNTIGYDNSAIGNESLRSNTSGYWNTATGSYSLWYNTIGAANTANGMLALYNNSTGSNNVADGVYALNNNTTGSENTACGVYSLSTNYSGGQNTAIGEFALYSNYSGNNNTAVRFNANVNANYNNTTLVGSSATGTASNQVRVGNSSVTSIGGQVGWTTLSDGRVKKNIKNNISGLTFINKLKPVSYNLDEEAVDKIIQQPAAKTLDGKIIQESAELVTARQQKEQIIYTGLVAQDVEKAAKELNYDFSGVDAPKNNKDLYGLRYAEFVVPLVKAVQELSVKNDSLESNDKQMQEQLSTLVKRISALEHLQQACCDNYISRLSESELVILNGSARLEQNAPNPFHSNTIIRYYIPDNSSNAQIIVTDLSAHILKTISISNKGEGRIIIKAGSLAAGNYFYTLIVDGKKIESKQMVLTK